MLHTVIYIALAATASGLAPSIQSIAPRARALGTAWGDDAAGSLAFDSDYADSKGRRGWSNWRPRCGGSLVACRDYFARSPLL